MRTTVGTWHALNYDSFEYYASAPVGHGDVIIKLFVDNPTDYVIRRITLHGDAIQGGTRLEVVNQACQSKNTEFLELPPRTNFAAIGFDDKNMECFVKLWHVFPSDPNSSQPGDAMDAERERVWALVRSVILENSWVEIEGTSKPLNAVIWLNDTWKNFASGVSNTVSYPFQRS